MVHKYEIERYEKGKWELFNTENEETKEFSSLKEIVDHLKTDKGTFTILDLYESGIAYFKDGVVTHVEAEYGSDDYMREHYMGIKPEKADDFEVDCYRCGDGGCIYCDPAMFL